MSDKNDKGQSFRLACDRCHAHKLRCPQNQMSASSDTCQRCLRAKTKCTFSPRARAGGVSKSTISAPGEVELQAYRNPRPLGDEIVYSADETFSYLNEQPSSISGLSPGSTTDFLDPEWMGYGSSVVQAGNTKLDGRGFNDFTFDLSPTIEATNGAEISRVSFADPIEDTVDTRTLVETNMETCSSLGDCTRKPEASIYRSKRAQNSTPSSSIHHDSSQGFSAPPFSGENSEENQTQKLSTLAVAFHQQLEKLNHGPWAKDPLQPGHGMGGYPIGDILQLSRELIGVLLSVSRDAGHDRVDVTTALLVLNCYISLIRTYSVVLADLNQYIRAVASSQLPEYTFQPRSGLLFEEIQPSNEALSRTQTASQMFLSTLARIENILHLPGECRCTFTYGKPATFDRAASTSRNDTTINDESCSNLEAKTFGSRKEHTVQSVGLVDD